MVKIGAHRLLVMLPFLLSSYDVTSGSGPAGESAVTWTGCPPTFVGADNVNTSAARCACTTFAEIRCYNLQSVPLFQHPPSVTWRAVHMARQGISELPSGAFGNLRTAKLVLNFNQLGDGVYASALAGQETSLVELQLAGCGITSLPARLLVGMDSLTRLHLWGNQLSQFPVRFFRAAANLRELLLWNNKLTALERDTLAGLWSLRRLDLDRNYIAELHKDAFRNLIELRSLHIAHNRVQALHSNTFMYLHNVRVLSLSDNAVEFIYDEAFEGLPNLLSLSLANNYINYLPENVFSALTNLTDLLLHNNRLEFVWPRTFLGLISLRRLSLAGNRLSSLPEAALRYSPSLRYIDLADNHLRSVGRCVFPARLATLRTVSFVGNPVLCNCSLAWLASGHVVWGTCRSDATLAYPGSKGVVIKSLLELANTCSHHENNCRFD